MSLTASVIFDAIAAEYATDIRKDTFLTLAEQRTSLCFFGTNYTLAIALRAAHMISYSDRGGNSGNISSQREGDLAISFGSINNNRNLNTTSYGQDLLQLIKETQPGVSVGGDRTFNCN